MVNSDAGVAALMISICSETTERPLTAKTGTAPAPKPDSSVITLSLLNKSEGQVNNRLLLKNKRGITTKNYPTLYQRSLETSNNSAKPAITNTFAE
jgi:hypothetical protein